ncbi:hypothetical protein TcasGA2_TC011270 [Tribolium castaneum]|uniref:THAP-type domain-containing protein n=1 Tax=Tribolium castaneum TaxID=7070 RepID=D6X3N3_TRICA|nr:hypothetical protein TcasGA2_TC011270 [Tribolium castaneum]
MAEFEDKKNQPGLFGKFLRKNSSAKWQFSKSNTNSVSSFIQASVLRGFIAMRLHIQLRRGCGRLADEQPPREHPNLSRRGRWNNATSNRISQDFRGNDLPKKNVVRYISGYLARKCLGKHTCPTCKEYARAMDKLDASTLFIHFKRHTEKYDGTGTTFGKLLMPAKSFVDFIDKLEKALMKKNRWIACTTNAQDQLLQILKKVQFSHSCSNFPIEYLIRFIGRMRCYYILKYANTNLTDSSVKNRKLIILSHR